MERRLAAILAADVVGYSQLMGADEAGTLDRLKALNENLVQPSISEHGGRIVKLMGDGVLAEFPSVVEAVRCAVEIQTANSKSDLPEDQRLDLRMGINLGDIIADNGDIYGDGVNLAARLEAAARPGSICLSQQAYDQIGNRLDIEMDDLGARSFKNIAKPVRVFEVRVGGARDDRSASGKHSLGFPLRWAAE